MLRFCPTFASNGATAMAVLPSSSTILPLTGSNGYTSILSPPIRSPGSPPAPPRALPRFCGAWIPSFGTPTAAALSAISRATSWRFSLPSTSAIPAPMPGATIIPPPVAIITLIPLPGGSIGFTSTLGLPTLSLATIPRPPGAFLKFSGSSIRSFMILAGVALLGTL